jgi:hypothetical protein
MVGRWRQARKGEAGVSVARDKVGGIVAVGGEALAETAGEAVHVAGSCNCVG